MATSDGASIPPLQTTTQPPTTPQPQTTPNKMVTLEGALLCLMVMVMDLTAMILGIEAEIAQNKMRHVRVLMFECKEPSNKAFSLGLAAACLLALAHVIASLLGGCVCICSQEELQRSSTKKKLSAASLVLSWIIVAVGFTMLVTGAMSNTNSYRPNCGFSHRNFLWIGGLLCFFHGLVCVAYYVLATAAEAEGQTLRPTGTQRARPTGTQPTAGPPSGTTNSAPPTQPSGTAQV